MATVDIFVSPVPEDEDEDVWDFYFEQPDPDGGPTTDEAMPAWAAAVDNDIESLGGRAAVLGYADASVREQLESDTCCLQLSSAQDADASESLLSRFGARGLDLGLLYIDPLENTAHLPNGETVEFAQ